MSRNSYAKAPYTPTRFPGGLTNANDIETLGNLGTLDPTKFHVMFDDFNFFDAADWTVVETQAAATQAMVTGAGGLVLLTNSAAANDINGITSITTSFRIDAGKRCFAKARVAVSDIANVNFLFGFANTIAAFTPVNGVYWSKAGASPNFTLISRNASVDATAVATPTPALAAATFLTLGIEYDPRTRSVLGYIHNERVCRIATPNINTGVDLLFTFAMQNVNAVANTATVDYLYAAFER